MFGVEAGSWKPKALDGTAVQQMFGDDLIDILELDKAVPDSLGIDDDHGAMLALVEAAGLVGPDHVLEAGTLDGVLEGRFELLAALRKAAWPGGVLVSLVGADEQMMLKFRHWRTSLLPAAFVTVDMRRTGLSETI